MFTLPDGYTFHDTNDPRLGYLLSKDVDFHYNNFTLGFFVQVNTAPFPANGQDSDAPICHIFKSDTSATSEAFLLSAWLAHKKIVRLPRDEIQYALAQWHYRHCVIAAWGSSTLQARLHANHYSAEENLVH